MTIEIIINLTYVVAAGLFIFGLKLLSHPASARKGNFISAIGMLIAVVATLLDHQIITYQYIFAGMLIGACYGGLESTISTNDANA